MGSFFSHLRIRHQLLIVLVLPIVILIILMANSIVDSVESYKDNERTSNLYKASVKMTNAIFELQKERALSNSTLSSHSRHLRDQLIVQRENTTEALTSLIEMDRNPLFRGLFPEVVYRIYFDEELYEKVTQIRTDVDEIRIDTYFSEYTEIIEGILRLFSAKSMMTDKPEVNSHIIALSKVLWLQEYAGRERSIAYALISRNKDTDQLLQQHTFNSSHQVSLSKDIIALSGIEDIRDSFEKMQRNFSNVSVQKVREAISQYKIEHKTNPQMAFSYDFGGFNEGSDWLNVSGERLFIIHQITKQVIDRIISLTEKDKEESLFNIFLYSVGAILTILTTVILGFIITGRLVVGIEAVTKSINEVKSGGQIDPDIKLTGHDEISVLSNNFYELAFDKALAEKDVALAAKVFSYTADSVLILDDSYTVINVNKAFSKLTGIEEEKILGLKIKEIFKTESDKEFLQTLWENIKNHGSWQGEFVLVWPDGKTLTTWSSATVVRDENGDIENYLLVYTDISVLQETQKQIEYLAHYDTLTGLANRSQLEIHISRAIARAKRSNKHIAMLFMDLNKFKTINDNLGHAVGDIVLKEIAARLKSCMREEDFIARQGGDEFIGIIEGLSSEHNVVKLLDKIIKEVESPIIVDNRELHLGISIGVSMYPDDASDMEELSSQSDMAMYKAKEDPNSSYKFFTDEMNEAVRENFRLENDLRHALKANELEVYFQPIINMLTENVTGLEALIRWKHPELGYISPGEFIPVAEESGMIIELGDFVIDQTLSFASRNRKLFGESFITSLNVSPEQIKHGDVFEKMIERLEHYNLPPSTIQVEITENLLVESVGNELYVLEKFHDSGIKIAIDDFGTGYSSLKYLKDFPIDVVKIDGSFVNEIGESKENEMLVMTIIDMAKGLGKKLIAEGVETVEQQDFLIKNECNIAQGFLYSKALSSQDFLAFIGKLNNVVVMDVGAETV